MEDIKKNTEVKKNIAMTSTRPKIIVFGVGGAGGNAVNNMINSNLQGTEFIVANTDAQALDHSISQTKLQLGINLTKGLGAGASPELGAAAAEESINELKNFLEHSNMIFITAGLGGGTGTGSAPVIARIAKELGILTVGVVTKPFHFEGAYRMRTAEKGLVELQQYVDTLIIIPNQNLFRIANEKTTLTEAFKMADDVLYNGVRSITDLMIMPGLINLDFADVRAVMSEMGQAMMGTGEASGEERAIKAAEYAIANPLLDQSSIKGARGVLINITGGPDITLLEVDNAANRIRSEVDNPEANVIFGSTFNPDLQGIVRVSVVATGIENKPAYETEKNKIVQPSPVQNFRGQINNMAHGNIHQPTTPIIPGEKIIEEKREEIVIRKSPVFTQESNTNQQYHAKEIPIQENEKNKDIMDIYESPTFLRKKNK